MLDSKSKFELHFEIKSKIEIAITFGAEVDFLAEIAIDAGTAEAKSKLSNVAESDRESNWESEPESDTEIKENKFKDKVAVKFKVEVQRNKIHIQI